MTLPKGYGGAGSGGGKERKSGGGGKGKKVGIGVGVALAAIIAAGVVGASVQPSNDLQSSNPQSSFTNQFPAGLSAAISVGRDPISRGSVQTVTVTVTDGGERVSGASIDGFVTYASGSTQKSFGGITDENGQILYSWRIGGNSSPGIFSINVQVSASGYQPISESGSFEVVRAS